MAPELLEAALELARAHHTDGLNVADLADHVGYSPFHFGRLFRDAVRLSPGRYLTALRLDSARRLLLTEPDPVIDIAVAVGFDSLSSFSRRFRAGVGVPPAALRRLARQIEDTPPRAFVLAGDAAAQVTIRPVLPPGVADSAMLWLGWYPHPAPIGLPGSGVLCEYDAQITVRCHEGAPWLMGFLVERGDEVHQHLAPDRPWVAQHPLPITAPQRIDLHFGRAGAHAVPLLSALPSLGAPA